MAKIQKIVLMIAAGLAVSFLLIYAVLVYVFSGWGLCANTFYQELASPNRSHRAVVFERNCGATTGFSTQLSVLSASEVLQNVPGNTNIVDGQPDFANLKLRWLTDDHLLVGNAVTTAHTVRTQVNSVTVTYE